MALLNYTTKIEVSTTIAEINSILVAAGATSILMDYDGAKNVTAVSFKAQSEFGLIAIRLPFEAAAAQAVLNKQVALKQIPRRYFNDGAQARRIGWRIIKDWLQAQLAIITMGMAKIEQVFLPYAQDSQGVTVYEKLREKKFSSLALEDAK